MKTIAVVTSTPWFVEGGHLVMARALVQALRDEGHEADLVLTPQNRFGRQGGAYLAAWLTDIGMAHNGRRIDQIISLRYPSYAVRHDNHVVWLNHTMREYYDRWDAFSAPLKWKGRAKERTRRRLIHAADRYLLTRTRPQGFHHLANGHRDGLPDGVAFLRNRSIHHRLSGPIDATPTATTSLRCPAWRR